MPASALDYLRLDRDGVYRRPKVVDEQVTLPNVITTNDRHSTEQFIERYARRMNTEQRLAELKSVRNYIGLTSENGCHRSSTRSRGGPSFVYIA